MPSVMRTSEVPLVAAFLAACWLLLFLLYLARKARGMSEPPHLRSRLVFLAGLMFILVIALLATSH